MDKHFTVSVFVIDKFVANFNILLIHHLKFDKWMVPGGHIEPHENQIEASRREVEEETGIAFDFFTFKGPILHPSDSEPLLSPEFFFEQLIPANSKQSEHYHLDFNYLGIYKSGELNRNLKETKGLEWVNIESLDELDMFDGTRAVLNYIKSKFESLTFKPTIYE